MFKLFKNKKKAKKEKEKEQKELQNDLKLSHKTTTTATNDENKENSPNKQPQQQQNEKQNDSLDHQSPSVQQQQQTVEMRNPQVVQQQHGLNVDCNLNGNESCQASPSVFTEQSQNFDSPHHHLHHYRSSQLSQTMSGADLNRVLTSGYLTGDEDMGYLKRGVDLRVPKSPHFHRPENFSYTHQVNLITSSHPYRKSSTLTQMDQVKKIRHSTSASPKRANIENEEPLRLSKFSGGYQPDPDAPAKIDSLDWPSPPYPPTVPELRSRSRSSSNRKVTSSMNHTADYVDGGRRNEAEQDDDADLHEPVRIHYTHKVYDDNYNDYTLKFRNYKTPAGYYATPNSTNASTLAPNNTSTNDIDIDVEGMVQRDPKLKRDLEEISKLENKSGMAKLFGIELKAQERLISKALDPWKASRTPSASMEPHQKTRYETPVNASPSRVLCCCNKVSVVVHEDGVCSTCGLAQQQQPQNNSQTCISSNMCSTPRKSGTIPKQTVYNATNIVCNIPVPKPGYGLSSPKSTTLPNSTRYYGMRKLSNSNTYKDYYIELRNAHTTRSTPNLTGLPPKIYPYSQLRLGYKKKLPVDVDRERLERHLAKEELQSIFGVDTLEKFYELPEWKRTELKKRAKLF